MLIFDDDNIPNFITDPLVIESWKKSIQRADILVTSGIPLKSNNEPDELFLQHESLDTLVEMMSMLSSDTIGSNFTISTPRKGGDAKYIVRFINQNTEFRSIILKKAVIQGIFYIIINRKPVKTEGRKTAPGNYTLNTPLNIKVEEINGQ